jgi:hypothetical protein
MSDFLVAVFVLLIVVIGAYIYAKKSKNSPLPDAVARDRNDRRSDSNKVP